LAQRALALQAQQNEAQEIAGRGFACITSRPAEAFQLLTEALEKCAASFSAQEEFLRQTDWGPAQIPQLRHEAVETRVQLLYGQGQAAFLLSRLPEARAAFEEALALIGDQQHPARPMLRAALANVSAQE
jgi:tetratricopeptide (TPR) repeat protein